MRSLTTPQPKEWSCIHKLQWNKTFLSTAIHPTWKSSWNQFRSKHIHPSENRSWQFWRNKEPFDPSLIRTDSSPWRMHIIIWNQTCGILTEMHRLAINSSFPSDTPSQERQLQKYPPTKHNTALGLRKHPVEFDYSSVLSKLLQFTPDQWSSQSTKTYFR